MATPRPAPASTSRPLAEAGWCPRVHAALEALLKRPDLAGRCAAFDWDNTCIDGDVGDAALHWQLDGLHLALPPHVLAATWQVPVDALSAAGLDPTYARALLADVVAAARVLWPASVRNASATVRGTPAHLDLRAKLGALYAHLSATPGPGGATVVQAAFVAVAKAWGGADAGLPPRCVAQVCGHADGRGDDVRAQGAAALARGGEVWCSATTGRAGCVTYALRHGLRPFAEVRALMSALVDRGVRVVVVSASFQPLVQAMAYAWGYPVAPRDVFGLRLAPARFPEAYGPRRFSTSLRRGYPVTFRAGKVDCLRAHRLEAPVLVAGDAPTDIEMLTHWPQTRLRLVMHRTHAAPQMASLYREAAAKTGGDADNDFFGDDGGPRTVLQGRDERTGRLWPRPTSEAAPPS